MIVEVLKETVFRRRFIPMLHGLYLGIYIMVYTIFYLLPSETGQWELWLFIWSGCLFPVLLTAGLFGDDIANGRILQLVIKPVSLGSLYLLRVLGVFVQCVVHLAVCYLLLFVVYRITGQEAKGHLGLWFLASVLISLTWLMLSASISTFLLREFNVAMILIGGIVVFMLWQSASIVASIADWPAISKVADGILIYGVPPVALLFRLGMQRYGMAGSFVVTLHAIAMAVLYAIIGIVILTHREFVRKRE
jgi:ABC-type transport system involved in multi-copper enzyme maturation permease subunit